MVCRCNIRSQGGVDSVLIDVLDKPLSSTKPSEQKATKVTALKQTNARRSPEFLLTEALNPHRRHTAPRNAMRRIWPHV